MGATALALLEAYRRTALLLASAAAVAFGAGLPVALTWDRLAVAAIGPGLTGLRWTSPVELPNDLRQQAVDGMFSALVGAAVAVVGVAALTLIALAAARMVQREREVAVRRAVGASRRMLFGGLGLEGLAIALAAVLAGAGPGILLAGGWWRAWPATLRPGGIWPGPLLGLSLVLLIVIGAMFPLLFARRPEITEPADAGIALRLPTLLLGGSLAVLATGLLLTRHLRQLTDPAQTIVEPGLVAPLRATATAGGDRARALGEALNRVAAVPGVEAPSLANPGALMGLGPASIIRADCGPCWPFRFKVERATHFFVTADSFRALGARIIEGRWISRADRFDSEPVALVSRRLALEKFFMGAVGRQLMIGTDPDRWYRVVGVVEEGPALGLGASLRPAYSVYLSVLQHPLEDVELVIPGSSVDARAVAAALSSQPGVRLLAEPASFRSLLERERGPLGWFGPAFTLEGVAMLMLAVTGTIALNRLWVLSLAGEIAVARAVGARRSRVLRSLLGRAALAGVWGAVLGGWLGPLFWEALRLWVPGLGGWDAGILVPLAALLLLATVTGAIVPARHILRTPPAELFGAPAD